MFMWMNSTAYCKLCSLEPTDKDLYEEYGINSSAEVIQTTIPDWCPLGKEKEDEK